MVTWSTALGPTRQLAPAGDLRDAAANRLGAGIVNSSVTRVSRRFPRPSCNLPEGQRAGSEDGGQPAAEAKRSLIEGLI